MARSFADSFGRIFSGADPRPRQAVRAPVTAFVAGLRFALPRPVLVDVHVIDITGNRVRTLACGEISAGEHECRWDGCDETGARCRPGRYVLRLESSGSLLTSRVVALA
jgi:hypothetical protein